MRVGRTMVNGGIKGSHKKESAKLRKNAIKIKVVLCFLVPRSHSGFLILENLGMRLMYYLDTSQCFVLLKGMGEVFYRKAGRPHKHQTTQYQLCLYVCFLVADGILRSLDGITVHLILLCPATFYFNNIELFSDECRKTETRLTHVSNIMSQSELEANTSNRGQARENACGSRVFWVLFLIRWETGASFF